MNLVYLDQNALIALGRKTLQFRTRVLVSIESGAFSVVVSMWHLIETANTASIQNAVKLAEFIDSLHPAWLLDKFDIQTLEVREDFCKFAKLFCQSVPRVTTKSAVFAALNRKRDSARFDIPSRRVVEQWLRHPDQLQPLETPYKNNAEALIRLRELKRVGKLTLDILRESNRKLLKVLVPKSTPTGVVLGRELPAQYIEQARIEDIPTLAIENAISQHEWGTRGGANRNTLIDKFHLIAALPYVDEIVSDDKFFHAIYPVTQKTGHVRARLLSNAEFLGGF